MSSEVAMVWDTHTRHTLNRYDEALLRQVAHNLCKPRNQWPVHELIDRMCAGLTNAAMVDRRLKELPVACRQIMAIIHQSRQTRWSISVLVETLAMLGYDDGLAPVTALLQSGLLLPELAPLGTDPDERSAARSRVKNIESWLTRSDPIPVVLAPPTIAKRAHGEPLPIEFATEANDNPRIFEADGLEWPMRLAVLWQQTLAAPLRKTQQGGFFKRDHERLRGDPLLCAAPTEALAEVPDPGFFTAALAEATGLLRAEGAELHPGDLPGSWQSSPLPTLLVELWNALARVSQWSPVAGADLPEAGAANPYASAYLMAGVLIAQVRDDAWVSPNTIEEWIVTRHPFWRGRKPASIGIATFLLGVAHTMRLLQATKNAEGAWLVRPSPLGRWLLGGADQQPVVATFKQTLLVQPNLEILAYRQGLTPELLARLSKIATWKTLGAACTLQLEPASVYRALEMGESLPSVTQMLEGHGMKAIPTAVLDSLKTWSNKRDRIRSYPAGAIFEFASPAEMNDAIARGLQAVRLTDRLAIVPGENEIDYKHFRLMGTRDYTLPPEKCVEIEPDGVTLSVNLSRSDLLLDMEMLRFAEPTVAPAPTSTSIARPAAQARRYYRVTPATMLTARQQGVTLSYLEHWFVQRSGYSIPAAAQLLFAGPESPTATLKRQFVLHVNELRLADGLQQWPRTRDIITARLGPTALVVDEANITALADRLKEANIAFEIAGQATTSEPEA